MSGNGNTYNPRPPKHLSPRGREIWKRIVSALFSEEYFKTIDLEILALAVEQIATFEHANNELQEPDGTLKLVNKITTKGGEPYEQERPYVAIRSKAISQVVKLFNELGITPTARKKLGVLFPEEDEYDDDPDLD